MNDDQLQKIGTTLEEILAELRKINQREEDRDGQATAVQDRFASL